MINSRLVWLLESNNLLTPFQGGVCRKRSTLDYLVRLETLICEIVILHQHMVAVVFDIEKAHDTTWKYGIMMDIHEMDLRGKLQMFVENFLKDTSSNVRLGSTISDEFEDQVGVP